MSTQEMTSFVLTLTRHLFSTDTVTLHVRPTTEPEGWWSVWVDVHGLSVCTHQAATLDAALETMIETLTLRVHRQMEDAHQILEETTRSKRSDHD